MAAMTDQWRHLFSDVKSSFIGNPKLSDLPDEAGLSALPASELVRLTFELPERAFQIHLLRRDPLYERFTPQQREQIIREGEELGRQYGVEFHSLGLTWEESIDHFGIAYKERTKPETAERVVFAEYVEPYSITVYTDTLNRYKESKLVSNLPRNASTAVAKKVVIGHELFHFLEYRDRESIPTRNKKFVTHEMGLFSLKAIPSSMSEIAAMAFAKEWAQLDYSPNVFDVLFMQLYEPKAATMVLREIQTGYANYPEN